MQALIIVSTIEIGQKKIPYTHWCMPTHTHTHSIISVQTNHTNHTVSSLYPRVREYGIYGELRAWQEIVCEPQSLLSSVQYKHPHYWKQQIFLAKQFPPQAVSLIALDVFSWWRGGGLKKKLMWDPKQSLVPRFFNFLPQSSCVEIEPESVIGVIILSHYVAESAGKMSSQLRLSLP